ncbi:dipeptidase [candidate division KSB1 bacterium]
MRNIRRVRSIFLIGCIAALAFVAMPSVNAPYMPEQDFEYEACTSVIVGKLASVDGSTMTSHSCDSGTDRTWINVVPHKTHPRGSTCEIFMDSKRTTGPDDDDRIVMGEIPQVPETYAYINTAYAVMNEYQLAIGETTFGGKRELRSDEGIIDCPELYRLCLERAKTGREAIILMDELTKKYGYNDGGECFTFADPNETWHFEILGPGRGRLGAVWAAVRIPDDHVGVSANASRIRQIDLDDKENYMASDNVFSLAEEMGWWDPDSGEPFEFCYAYASRTSMGSRRREWRALSLVAPSLNLNPNAENYPFSVKAERKLSVRDVLDIFRSTYQDTPYDMTRSLTVVNRSGETVKSPVANPFMNRDMLTLLNIPSERTICCPRATYVTVTQSRNWLPDAIGGVVWLGYDNPATTPHIPFYCGISQMPESYMVDGRAEFRRDCAWWSFRRVSQLALFRYQEMSKDIETVWREIEDSAFANQPGFEEEALGLYRENPERAKELLTKYCDDMANNSVERYWKLGDELWTKYNRSF